MKNSTPVLLSAKGCIAFFCLLSLAAKLPAQRWQAGLLLSPSYTLPYKEKPMENKEDAFGIGAVLFAEYAFSTRFGIVGEYGVRQIAFPQNWHKQVGAFLGSPVYERVQEFKAEPILVGGLYPKFTFTPPGSKTVFSLSVGIGACLYPVTSESTWLFSTYYKNRHIKRAAMPGLRLSLRQKLTDRMSFLLRAQANSLLGLEPETKNNLIAERIDFVGLDLGVSFRL